MPDHPDHFALLQCEQKFNLDDKQLTAALWRLQKQYHPDKLHNRPAEEQEAARELSMHINSAYKVLKNPHSRAVYMLQLNGIDTLHTKLDMEFLEQMMTLMARVQFFGELDAAKKEELQQISAENEALYEELLLQLDSAFSSADLRQAEQLTGKLKFLINVRELVKEKLHGSDWSSTEKH